MGRSVKTQITRVTTACAPCRKSKSRCDGHFPCQNCAEKDRVQDCIFIHRRGRYKKDQERRISEAKDRTIKILYDICEAENKFPGSLPSGLTGPISSTTIMAALGILQRRQDGTLMINERETNIRLKPRNSDHELSSSLSDTSVTRESINAQNLPDTFPTESEVPSVKPTGAEKEPASDTVFPQNPPETTHAHLRRASNSTTRNSSSPEDFVDTSALNMAQQFSRASRTYVPQGLSQTLQQYRPQLDTAQLLSHRFPEAWVNVFGVPEYSYDMSPHTLPCMTDQYLTQ